MVGATRRPDKSQIGAGSGNRTRINRLETCCSTTEPYPPEKQPYYTKIVFLSKAELIIFCNNSLKDNPITLAESGK